MDDGGRSVAHGGRPRTGRRMGRRASAMAHRLTQARAMERERLRREIHDALGPDLAAVRLQLDAARRDGLLPRAAEEHVRMAVDALEEAMAEARRITAGALTPVVVAAHGLLDATRLMARRLSAGEVSVQVACLGPGLPALPAAVQSAAYLICAEAAVNAVRHARAGRVDITFTTGSGLLSATVTDDGIGLPADAVPGTGLASIVHRATDLGGTVAVDTGPQGTTVRLTLPLTPRPTEDHMGSYAWEGRP